MCRSLALDRLVLSFLVQQDPVRDDQLCMKETHHQISQEVKVLVAKHEPSIGCNHGLMADCFMAIGKTSRLSQVSRSIGSAANKSRL